MSDLHLTFAETGPIPDNQCALKDAILLALHTGETDAEVIVGNAARFLAFLGGGAVQNPVAATPPPPMGSPEPAPEETATDEVGPNGFPAK